MWKGYKYLAIISLPLLVGITLNLNSFWVWLPAIYVFIFIPFLELFLKPDTANLQKFEEEMVAKDRSYDFLLYLMLPVHFGILFLFLLEFTTIESIDAIAFGKIFGMGIMCGVFGINVAHELGHRKEKFERFLSKSLLLSPFLHLPDLQV
jgi:alkane 1-monooxygenase